MHHLVIQFPLRHIEPGIDEFEALVSLEEELARVAGGAYSVDGHDAGEGEMSIFILTDDAVATFNAIRSKLPADLRWCAGFRDLDSDAYTLLEPGLAGER